MLVSDRYYDGVLAGQLWLVRDRPRSLLEIEMPEECRHPLLRCNVHNVELERKLDLGGPIRIASLSRRNLCTSDKGAGLPLAPTE